MCSANKNDFLTMEIKYYKSGLRPVYREIEKDYSIFYAFQWDTGEFKEDMTYNHQIRMDPDGDVEELTKEEFDNYVEQLRKEITEVE